MGGTINPTVETNTICEEWLNPTIGRGTEPRHRMNWIPKRNWESRFSTYDKEKGRASLTPPPPSLLEIFASPVPPPMLSTTTHGAQAFGDTVPPSPGQSASCVPLHHFLPRSYVSHFIAHILWESYQYDQPCKTRTSPPTRFQDFGEAFPCSESQQRWKAVPTSSRFVLLHWQLQSRVIRFQCGDRRTPPQLFRCTDCTDTIVEPKTIRKETGLDTTIRERKGSMQRSGKGRQHGDVKSRKQDYRMPR